MVKLINIVGARPQFIKAAVISRAIKRHNGDHWGTAIEEFHQAVATGERSIEFAFGDGRSGGKIVQLIQEEIIQ
jgi:UDP-N-acetylglucosamine 2-epimerase